MQASKGTAQVSLQLPKVFWRAVGQVVLHLGPDELIGIELGGVGREPVRDQPWVPARNAFTSSRL